ncbi:dCTP pyrophosphatase 1 isoform X2 [Ambystoma mexicanum]|uniref:dCTP pyrophosphatase 1 isoform X2 n=1 Tax=Ambystoma mexicanum TaxID=8296 RepID=UPI0037E72DD4
MEGSAVTKTSEAVGANGVMEDGGMVDEGGKISTNMMGSGDVTPTGKGDVTPTGKGEQLDRFHFSASPSLEEIRQRQADFTDERDWNQFHKPRNLLLAMVGEVGEVAEHFQWRGEVAAGLPDWTEKERRDLSHELSDVLIYLVELAEKCHVDLPQAVLAKMELNARKYPACKVHGSAKKYTEYKD